MELELEKEDLNRHLNERDQTIANLKSEKKELEEAVANLTNEVLVGLQQENEENNNARLEHERRAKGIHQFLYQSTESS